MSQNGLAAYFAGIRMFRLIQFDDRPLRAAARRPIITRALSFARVSGAILLVASSGASITPKPQLMAARRSSTDRIFSCTLMRIKFASIPLLKFAFNSMRPAP
jgi:hypothetical protein